MVVVVERGWKGGVSKREMEQRRERPLKEVRASWVSEVERSGGRQWQPPREAPVYSPAPRP